MLTPTEEAQTRDLIAQQAALLSLAGNEATITSKLGATKVTLSALPSASSIGDTDLLLLRQGTTDKSATGLLFKNLIPVVPDATDTVKGISSMAVGANFPSSSDTESATPLYVRNAYISKLLPFSAALSSNTLVNTLAPSVFEFRPTSLNSGSYNTVNTGTLTLTVPTAASIGLTTLTQGRLMLLVAYNAGTPVLCIANPSSGLQLDETNLISPTTISAGSTSATTIYSASAVAANSPYRIVGFVDVIWTSGTGFTTLTEFQGAGGVSQASGNNAALLATSGYQKLSNGLILQWSGGTVGGTGTTAVSFPIVFPQECFRVITGITYSGSGAPSAATAAAGTVTASGFNLGSSAALSFNYIAIGR